MTFTVKEALLLLKKNNISYVFNGCLSLEIRKACAFNKMEDYALSFSRNLNVETLIAETNNTQLLVLRNDVELPDNTKGNFLLTDNPDLVFRIIASLLKPSKKPIISQYAVVESAAVLGKNISIGAFCYIGKNVVIGDNCLIYDNCTINNAVLGNNVIIQSGVRIGNPGLGSKLDKKGVFHDFPHFGKVLIGNNVIVQDNTVVNQGTLNDTTIGSNSRIGPLCRIGHGVNIGTSCFISQGATIAGSAIIGNFSKIWGNASVRDGLHIGENCVVGMGSVVIKNLPDGEIWAGNPAGPLKK